MPARTVTKRKNAGAAAAATKPSTPQASSPVLDSEPVPVTSASSSEPPVPMRRTRASASPRRLSGQRAQDARGRRVRLGNIRKISSTPMSPRSVTNKFNSTARPSNKELRDATANINRSIGRITQIATALGKAGTNGEVVSSGGEKTTREDLNKLIAATTQAIKVMPWAAQRSTKRTPPELTPEERSSRIEGLIVKVNKGIKTLCSSLKNKNAEAVLSAYKTARINEIVKPSLPDSGDQISSPFYISDQLRLFFQEANLGNGIALFYPRACSDSTRAISGADNFDAALAAVVSDIKATGVNSPDPVSDLGGEEALRKLADPRNIIKALVIERGIATSPLLMSLMALYILANGLKDSNGRIRVDSQMKKFFGKPSNTRAYIAGNDMTAAAETMATSAASAEVSTKIKESLAKSGDTSQSGLDRLSNHTSKSGKVSKVPFDGETMTRSMSITLAFYYRVRWVPTNMADDLNREGVKNLAYGVKAALVK